MLLKLLIYCLLFFLPTQLGRHFWFDFSYKLGARVDYLSPTIYFTDIIVTLIIAFYFFKKRKLVIGNWKLVLGILVLLEIGYWNLVIAENLFLLLYNLVKLMEMVLLAIIVVKTLSKRDFPQVIKVLNLALVIQLALALYQVVVEKSSGLWIIGERAFSIQKPGIAKFVAINGVQLLRGYGTFPHPNVLAGFSLVLLVLNITMLIAKKPKKLWWFCGIALSLSAIFLSFSLLAWGLSLAIIIFNIFKKKPILAILLSIILNSYFIIQVTGESVTRRLELLNISWQLFKTSPVFGIGLGNFIPKMPVLSDQVYFWQPVHNIFVLVATETGLVGLAFLIWLFIKIWQRKSIILNSYFIILVIGMFDHYWLTLQQGRLLLAIIIALSLI